MADIPQDFLEALARQERELGRSEEVPGRSPIDALRMWASRLAGGKWEPDAQIPLKNGSPAGQTYPEGGADFAAVRAMKGMAPTSALANNAKLPGGPKAAAQAAQVVKALSDAERLAGDQKGLAASQLAIIQQAIDKKRANAEATPESIEAKILDEFMASERQRRPEKSEGLGGFRDALNRMKGPLYTKPGLNGGGGVNLDIAEGYRNLRAEEKAKFLEEKKDRMLDFTRMTAARGTDQTANEARRAGINAAEIEGLQKNADYLGTLANINQTGFGNVQKEREFGLKERELGLMQQKIAAMKAQRLTPVQQYSEWVEYFTARGDKDPKKSADTAMRFKPEQEFKYNKDAAEMVMPQAQKLMANVPPKEREQVWTAFTTAMTQEPPGVAMQKLQQLIQAYQR